MECERTKWSQSIYRFMDGDRNDPLFYRLRYHQVSDLHVRETAGPPGMLASGKFGLP